jgi:hypothetical protein
MVRNGDCVSVVIRESRDGRVPALSRSVCPSDLGIVVEIFDELERRPAFLDGWELESPADESRTDHSGTDQSCHNADPNSEKKFDHGGLLPSLSRTDDSNTIERSPAGNVRERSPDPPGKIGDQIMAAKKKAEHFPAYYIRTKGVEIGPFRSREAALAEAKAIRESDPDVKIRQREVTREAFNAPVSKKKDSSSSKKKTDDDEDLDSLFDDDDDEEEEEDDDDDLFDSDEDADEEEEEEDDDDDEDDDPPSITHPFFRTLGKDKTR